ncbi:glycoside hydrolase family 3 N-terminal domain-containing protein [Piscinibacter gummiphilus]|nr:glycoside hydrolase family 3 N-terminal domain-containing protein [Piscinibacter gummiphilus]ATU63818.1 beta-glucosidase [Piscinibacter gummiphilus]GLS93242.1 beta-glucosidase [Piscinibacter gummiphilus]
MRRRGLLFALPVLACTLVSAAPAPTDFVETLLARMTVEEKVGQLSLFAPVAAGTIANPETRQPSAEEQRADLRAGRITGFFNGQGLAGKREAQRIAVTESRLGIPLLFAADVIHGFRTTFPVPLAEAASWDPDLAERTARAAAVEAAADGFRWTFAPMVDIARDARWGRGVEGAGEDVFLGRRFAAARVRGFQGADLSRPDAMAATVKHFAAYGAAEGGLDYNTVDLSERTLREVYLPPFEAGLDAGALAVMTSFNEIAGVPSNANPWLLGQVLRGEWKFPGVVVSDYTADEELIAHGVAADAREATRLSFLAGTDISMQSGLYRDHLPALVASGEVPLARLDDAVRRVLRLKQRLGLFDDPMRGLDAPERTDWPEHRALAREAAARSIVLLKNDGALLPLPKVGRRIALVGPFTGGPADLNGPWTLFPGPRPPVGLAEGLRAAMARPSDLLVVPGTDIAPAVAAARRADVVLLALGETEAQSGEARSRTGIGLPPAQQALAEAVAATGKPVVVLLRTGRALALQGAVRDAQAVAVTWFLGSETGHAVADVLFGDTGPTGRLPVSFPRESGQVPYHYAHKPTGRPVVPSRPEAFYTTRYLDSPHTPLYPFGHGLGYGDVVYEDVSVSPARLPWNGVLTVTARITNRGARDTVETVQLYVHDRVASVTRPVRELKAFRRVPLAAGASATITFRLDRSDLRFIGPEGQWVAEPGAFDIWIAPSAGAGQQAGFMLEGPTLHHVGER